MNKHITLKNGIVVSPMPGKKLFFRVVSIPKSYPYPSALEIGDPICIAQDEQVHTSPSSFSFRSEPLLSFPEKELARLLDKPKFRVLLRHNFTLIPMSSDFKNTYAGVQHGGRRYVGRASWDTTHPFSFDTGFSIALSRALEALANECRKEEC